ncbi:MULTISPECIES: response regulator [Archaeoglobus]|jgi:CheY-like chemotaxis protein|nr:MULTISPECIES: response regulator [Archaeoglobus]AIG97942.1 Response regulator [Archaeoglobus fulgidus DSM 8774]KUJ94045.1 MAG: Response regulator [Archaeoglobus fulgidus]KUK06610.1 MAG: Response regulator [Archaeoglobus fulgidus]MDI3498366.1 hypothetical protein [Archaeoglobus sp.]
MTKILVVDDDCSICELYKEILGSFEVVSACSGREGLELYRKLMPDLVIVDINMPDISGVEVAKEIFKLNPEAVVIVVTAYYQEFESKMLRLGAKEVLGKPFNLKHFRECVAKYLNKGS